jgi:hypothetical protein
MLLSVVGLPIALGLFVCFVLFWVQMYQYGKRLRESEGGYRTDAVEADYDDDFQRPRRDEDDLDRPRRRPPEDEFDDRGERPRRGDD